MSDIGDARKAAVAVRVSRRAALGGLGSLIAAAAVPQVTRAAPLPARRGGARMGRISRRIGGAAAVKPVPRRCATATVLPDGTVLVAGGFHTHALSSAHRYNPRSRTWLTAAPMITARYSHTAVALQDGRVLVAGGQSQGPLATAEIYDPRSDSWSQAASMNGRRCDHAAVLVDGGLVLVTGGCGDQALLSSELYDPAADLWRRV